MKSHRKASNNESTAHHTHSHWRRHNPCLFAKQTTSASPAISDRSCPGRCFKCHGPDENSREAALRLDQRQEAIDLGAIVPGSTDESSLLERVTSDVPDARMPPEGDPLSEKQIKALRSWIKAGAKYEQHWAYKKPKPVALPQINRDWPRTNPIDNFVQARLSEEGMQPSPTCRAGSAACGVCRSILLDCHRRSSK